MELKEYIKILRKHSFLILIFTIAAVAIGMLYSQKSFPGYKLEEAFLIYWENPLPSPSTQEIAVWIKLQSAQDESRNFTDTAVALIQNGDFNQSDSTTGISAQKIAPQLIEISLIAQNPEEAKIKMERVVINFNQKVRQLLNNNSFELRPVGAHPSPTLNKIDSKIILAASFFAGLTFALFTISLKSYFKL